MSHFGSKRLPPLVSLFTTSNYNSKKADESFDSSALGMICLLQTNQIN